MTLASSIETKKVKTTGLEDVKDKLTNMSLFSQLSSDDLKGLVEKSSLRQFEAGSVICREGDYGDTAFAILGGSAEVSINTAGYKNLTLALLGEGNIFGEMAALSGYPRSATVSAKDPLYLLEIPAEVLKNLMKHSPEFKDAIEVMYAERAVKTYLRKVLLFSNLDESTLERLEKDVNLKSYKSGDII